MSDHNLNPSEPRLNANRHNAQSSTGPKTPEGKLVSSKNAIKTALTGRTVLLPTDDADRYHSHIQAFKEEIHPEGQRETLLTQSLADAAWRLERIAGFEMAIYAKDRALFSNNYLDEADAIRPHLIELDIYQCNEKQLRNLALQESRVRRQRDRDNEELRYLQAERKRLVEEKLQLAVQAYQKAKTDRTPFDPTTLGFVFSIPEIEAFLSLRNVRRAMQSDRIEASSSASRRLRIA
jgi:hypothetical protein